MLAIQIQSMTIRSFLAGTISQLYPLLFNEGGFVAREVVERIDKIIITQSNLDFDTRARLHRLAPSFEIL